VQKNKSVRHATAIKAIKFSLLPVVAGLLADLTGSAITFFW
jgi:hypothetical protein